MYESAATALVVAMCFANMTTGEDGVVDLEWRPQSWPCLELR